MTRRNFVLLLIVLLTITTFALYYLASSDRPGGPEDRGGGTNFFSEFNPFRSSPRPPQTQTPAEDSTITLPDTQAVFKRVSSMPIAGYGIFKKERLKEVQVPAPEGASKPTPPQTELVSAVRYVARENGNIYQTFIDSLDERKFSDTIISKVYEAYIGNNGQSVVMRYLQADEITIETFIGALPKEVLGADTRNIQIKGTFLPENIKDVILSPDKLKLIYLAPGTDGVTISTINFPDNKRAPILNSAFTEWQLSWPNPKMIALTTKPSALAPGYIYSLDSATKKLSRLFGEISGLTTLGSPDGKLVLYSGSDLSLQLYEVATQSFRALGLRTMPEKCVWSKNSALIYCAVPRTIESVLYPDAWYKGEVSFSDQIWKIDVLTGATEIILDPETVTVELDGIKLGLDNDEKYLFMVNKKDSYLWELNLSN